MKRILVTGGAGFIGSHLVKRLVEEGKEVVVVDNLLRGNKLEEDVLSKIEFNNVNVKNRDAMIAAAKGCDLIYHLAAVLGVDIVADHPVETMQTEVIGMQNVVDAAEANGINKIIYASTSGVYGKSAISQSFRENIQLDPRTSYAIAKRFNEIYLAALFEEKKINSISLRFFNIYGKGQDNRMVIPRFFEQAIAGKPISVYGDGGQTRDFTYIDDAVEACYLLANKLEGSEIYNIGCGEDIKILDLAHMIKKITNSTSEVRLIDAPKKRYDFEIERRFSNSEKLFKSIGFKPAVPLVEGLKKTFEEVTV